jgi:hypothetical protein
MMTLNLVWSFVCIDQTFWFGVAASIRSVFPHSMGIAADFS